MLRFLLVPVLLAAGWIGASPIAATAEPVGLHATAASTVSAQGLLNRLSVHSESHTRWYKASAFLYWTDADGDGEDADVEVFKAESVISTIKHDNGSMWMGLWDSPYDGGSEVYASKMRIDHLVSPKEAWRSGAWKWSAERREAFANDVDFAPSLVAVTKRAAEKKAGQDPASYLPSDADHRCAYVRNWVAVKSRWNLTVDRSEKAALQRALTSYCTSVQVKRPAKPDVSTLIEHEVPAAPDADESASVPVEAPAPVVAEPLPVVTTPYYSNCDAVRAAGRAPLYSFQSGYRSDLDSDGDGIACEDEPIASPSSPISTGGASAICRDGSLSYSASRSGTCSGHGGVRTWL